VYDRISYAEETEDFSGHGLHGAARGFQFVFSNEIFSGLRFQGHHIAFVPREKPGLNFSKEAEATLEFSNVFFAHGKIPDVL
jgi:hypothetical protein